MALIQCIECGKEISSTAEHCPYCGIPLKVMIGSHMPQPEQQIVLTKQSAPQPEESVRQYPQTQPSPQPEESVQQYQTQPEQFVQQYQQTQPSPQPVQQYQQTQPSPQPVQQYQYTQPSPQPQPGQFGQQYQYTQQSPQQKPEKKPISFTKPLIVLSICVVICLICCAAGGSIGGVTGANILGFANISSCVGAAALILLIVRLVEWVYRKLKK